MRCLPLPRPFVPLALAGAASLAVLGGVGAQDATPNPEAMVETVIRDAEGGEIGTVRLSEVVTEGVQIAVDLDAGVLSPGEHGIHVHETGVCDPAGDQPFASAGGHYNPTDADHGGLGDPDAHAGDLGNITVAEEDPTSVVIPTDRFELAELNDADGSALVIHADRDDLETDPSGNSGARVACAVIYPPQDGATPEAGTPEPDFPVAEANGIRGVGTPDPDA